MVLSMHGRESEVDHFHFMLAEKLGKTVHEIMEMSHIEQLHWRAYYVAKHSMENQRAPIER